MKLIVEGMTCGHCVRTITTAIQTLDSAAKVDIDLIQDEVRISGNVTATAAFKAIQDAGYTVVAILDDESSNAGGSTAAKCCSTCTT